MSFVLNEYVHRVLRSILSRKWPGRLGIFSTKAPRCSGFSGFLSESLVIFGYMASGTERFDNNYTFFYRQLDFPSEPVAFKKILENELKSCLAVA